jgi:hypothetical protein
MSARVLVLGILYFALGASLGIRNTGGGSTTVKVETPRAPTPSK